MTQDPVFLFVYGTLLAQSGHPMGVLLNQHATEIGRGTIQARLYIIEEEDTVGTNRYPGAVPSAFPSDQVHGVVYEVHDPDSVFPAFDDFEACSPGWPEPYEFLLRPIDVTLATGALQRARSYLYTWDTSRATLIRSGRFDQNAANVR